MVKGAAWGAALLVSALAILPFLPTLGGQFLNWDEASRRQGDAAEAERLRQEATELWAAMPTAKRPVEIPGRDRETARP